MTIYLYKKTHNITGLQYLGKTISKDPHKYKGSGDIWIPHIKKHGYDVTTEILKECQTKEELTYWGLYYSKLWDVVNARDENGRKIWANLKPETGDGGSSVEIQNRPEVKKKKSDSSKKIQSEVQNRPDVKRKNSVSVKKALSDPAIKQRHRNGCIKAQNTPERKKKRALQVGKNASNYNHTRYTFQHNDGTIEHCTRQELLKKYNLLEAGLSNILRGRTKTHMGWKII